MAMLKSGVALAKIECFRDLFEENALALTSVPNMRHAAFALCAEAGNHKD